MVTINTSNMHSLSELTAHLSTQNQSDDKELRAHGGKDIFVKEGAPKNTNASSRANHRNNAKTIVVGLLVKQGLPEGVAKAMVKNVLNGENKLTLGNLKDLERLSTGPQENWPSVSSTSKPTRTGKTGQADALIKKHQGTLQKLGDFACTDLDTFGDKRSGFYQSKAKPRLDGYYANPTRVQQNQKANMSANMAQLAAKRGNSPQISTLQNIAKSVQDAKAGCCSTFAFTAASEMIQGMKGEMDKNTKVEVVAFQRGHAGTHLYVLVGRQDGSDIKDPSTWNKDVRIVDPWATSAFGAPMFGDATRPPVSNMFPPSEVVFDSHKLK